MKITTAGPLASRAACRSSSCREGRLGSPYEDVDISKAVNRSAEFRGKNPLGTPPLLELDDGTYIAEERRDLVATSRKPIQIRP